MFPQRHAVCEHRRVGRGILSLDLYLKHREYNALLGALGMFAALIVRMRLF
jgi:hypothetical protein